MSLKKTWFSYVLWFIFAGLTVLITYSILTEVLFDFYEMLGAYAVGFSLYVRIGAKILTMLLVAGFVVLLHFLCGKIKMPVLPKWAGISLHVVVGFGIVAGFCALRYPMLLNVYTQDVSAQEQYFFELSKVGAVTGTGLNFGTVSILEQVYTYVLRTIFLFFGNKAEFLQYFQLFLQAASLILLMVIGWTMRKGIFAWIPALLYAVMPSFFYTAQDVGYTNFWLCIVILVLFIICLFERIWKKKNITYLVMVFAQLLFAGFVFFTKMDVLLYGRTPFVSGGKTPGVTGVLDIEMLVLAVLLIAYCVSFWFDKQDHKTLFVLPTAVFGFLFVWLSNYEFDSSYCLMLLAVLNLFFLFSQSMCVIFKTKPEVITGQSSVSKDVDMLINQEEKLQPTEFEWEEVAIDRTAPIENVLPMPKKHKPRVLDYAFEPSEDMMHYDVEIENDEYDY